MGGLSPQREASASAGRAVSAALRDMGCHVVDVFVDRDLDLVLRQEGVEVAFNALLGRYGEDGCLQGMLELLGIPYTGSGPVASALAADKARAKEVLRLYNLPTPPSYVLGPQDLDRLERVHGTFGFPCVVKPVTGALCMGVGVVHAYRDLVTACEEALRFDEAVLVERYVPGIELSVAVLNGRALGAVEIVPHGDLFDYRARQGSGRVEFHCPARLSPGRYQGVLTQAVLAYRALGCRGLATVDLVLSHEGNETILEVNTVPALLPTSPVLKVVHAAGMSFEELLEAMLDAAALGPRRPSAPVSWADDRQREDARPTLRPLKH